MGLGKYKRKEDYMEKMRQVVGVLVEAVRTVGFVMEGGVRMQEMADIKIHSTDY